MGEGKNRKPLVLHLLQVQKSTGHVPKELRDQPEIPLRLEHIWEWFMDLHSARRYGAAGPQPISFSEIQAWASLYDEHPSWWEVNLIRQLDNLYMDGTQNGFSETEHRD